MKDTKETKAPLPKIGPYDLALLAATLRPNLSLRKDEYTSALSAAYSLYTGAWEFIEGMDTAAPAEPPPVIDTELPEGPPARIGTLPTKPEIGNALPEPEPAPESESKGRFFGKKRG